jgi:hypothetical protein
MPVLLPVVAPSVAHAGTIEHVDLTAGTIVPVAAELRLSVETRLRLRGDIGIGILPSPYVELTNGVATSLGWYGPETATLIDAALDGSLIVSGSLGARPFRDAGFTLGAGYRAAVLGGSVSTSELLYAATGRTPERTGDAAEVDARAGLHMVTAEAGWDIVLRERWILRPSVGAGITLAAPVDLQANAVPTLEARLEPVLSDGEQYLSETMRTYVHTPTVGLHVGYRF